jgi:hypothetical protein
MSDIKIHIIDRDKKKHTIVVPTDMNMNLMEACKSYEFPIEGICGGMAMCASCHVYVAVIIYLRMFLRMKKLCFQKLLIYSQTQDLGVKSS